MTSLVIDKTYPVSMIASAASGLRLDLTFSDLLVSDRFRRVLWRANARPVVLRFRHSLQLLDATGKTLWEAGKDGRRCSFGNDGVLLVTDKTGKTVFTTSRVAATRRPGQNDVVFLDKDYGTNERIFSPDGRSFVVLQEDGNLVVYDNQSKPLWASGTIIHSLVFGHDGFLVVRDQRDRVLWSSPQRGTSCVFADSGLAIYDGGDLVWSTRLDTPPDYTPTPTAIPPASKTYGALPIAIVIIILLILIVVLLLVISDDQDARQQQQRRQQQK